MRRLVIGVIGHVDHGKTALVGALTGMQTDRLAEEQARGISIALGFAHLRLGSGDEEAQIDLIDMPGHERFVRTMVSGATGIDAVLLVVDAREGVMPQTREHLDIAGLLGVRRAVIAIARTDLADVAEIAATAVSAADAVAARGLQAAAPVACSARTGAGLACLRARIEDATMQAVPAADDGAPLLPIDRSFSVAGHGTVVTGTLRGGRLAAGDTLQIAPSDRTARIRALQVHGQRVAIAEPGQRVAVNLRGIEPAAAPRGACLSVPGTLAASQMLCVRLQAVSDAPVLPTGSVLRLLFGTTEVDARLRLLDRDVLDPGAFAYAQLRCQIPVSVAGRVPFVLRAVSPPRTLAGGSILDPASRRARRHAPGVIARLAALADAAPAAIVLGELERAGPRSAGLAQLARLAGLGAAQTASVLAEAGAVIVRGTAIGRVAFHAVMADLPRALASRPDGVPQAALVSLLPDTPAAILEEAASRLTAAGTIVREGAILRVPRPAHDQRQARLAADKATHMAETLRAAGLSPPDPAMVAPDAAARRLLDGLVRTGIVIRAPDRVQKRDILFHSEAVAEARRQLTTLLAAQPLLVSEIGAALGISRKFSVPLLEHLDSVQFTRRVAERRVLARDG